MESHPQKNHTIVMPHRYTVHNTLAYSYLFYFIFLLFGVFLDLVFKIKIYEDSTMQYVGLILLSGGTILIVWAQISYVNLGNREATREHFRRGPYSYTRNPTHWGIFFLMLGFGFVVNGFFIVLTTIVSHILTKFTFIRKHEAAMLRNFGAAYEEYKKLVKF